MKWTENGVEFEGTPEEYLILHPVEPPKRIVKKKEGKRVTVIDLGGEEHIFLRIKDAAAYISMTAQRAASSVTNMICKRTSDRIFLKDYMVCNASWNPEVHQEAPHV